eukprot:g6734.t1
MRHSQRASGATREQQEAMAMAQVQQLLESQKTVTKLTGKCFSLCVATPGTQLATQQQACLWRCAQRYMELSEGVCGGITARGGSVLFQKGCIPQIPG